MPHKNALIGMKEPDKFNSVSLCVTVGLCVLKCSPLGVKLLLPCYPEDAQTTISFPVVRDTMAQITPKTTSVCEHVKVADVTKAQLTLNLYCI